VINIEIPKPNVIIYKQQKLGDINKTPLSSVYGFTDYELIPRNVPGIYMFYNQKDDLLYCGKTNSLRQRIRTHFCDTKSAIRFHRDEVFKISVCFVKDPFEREIYETYINHFYRAKYNADKVFFDRE
jgi:excinuclease UvrABC nuclease subunit